VKTSQRKLVVCRCVCCIHSSCSDCSQSAFVTVWEVTLVDGHMTMVVTSYEGQTAANKQHINQYTCLPSVQ